MSLVIWRIFLFALFALFAAPLEYHVAWFAPWSRSGGPVLDALASPLTHGALFFYSVIIAVEALFRIEMHPYRADRPAARVLKACCFIVPLSFVGFLIRGMDQPLQDGWVQFELWLAVSSLVISVVTFIYLDATDRIQNPAPVVPRGA